MLNISGYLGPSSEIPIVDDRAPIVISSFGHFRLSREEYLITSRPAGRPDYQLLYIAGGTAHFWLKEKERVLPEGHTVLYRPGESQRYTYKAESMQEIYWVHFSGRDAAEWLDSLGFGGESIRAVGEHIEYTRLFEQMIQELQLRREHHTQMTALYCLQLFTLMSRQAEASHFPKRDEQVEEAIRLFHARFHEPLEIAEIARGFGMSPCWFTRLFHRQTGLSPQQYLTDIRINKARELLATTNYNVSEVADLTGYPNPLYFSRIFKKHTGVSPSRYKQP